MSKQAVGCRYFIRALLPFLAAVAVVGCVGGGASTGISIEPLPNHEVAALDSDDIVRIMKRAGFSDEQILEHGTELRNTLATSGAVQIRIGEYVEAIFAVSARYLHITTRLRGSFMYDFETGTFL